MSKEFLFNYDHFREEQSLPLEHFSGMYNHHDVSRAVTDTLILYALKLETNGNTDKFKFSDASKKKITYRFKQT